MHARLRAWLLRPAKARDSTPQLDLISRPVSVTEKPLAERLSDAIQACDCPHAEAERLRLTGAAE